jgi:uncharacterized membrane protein YhaH (DUF805 family)
MFAGTLGRSQFFVRSCIVGIAETVLLLICIAVQYQAFIGPPGAGRYQLAMTVFLVSGFFCFKRIGFAIRRNRDAGGGDLLPGLYAIGICAALLLQVQALIVRTNDSPLNGLEYAGLLYLALTGAWLYLLLAASEPGGARFGDASATSRSHFGNGDAATAPSQLSLAMEQAIAGTKPIPAAPMPAQPQGFLGSVRRAPPPPQRTEFGRRGVK